MSEMEELARVLEGWREPKVCALPTCQKTFTPVMEWQICCCKSHSAKLRDLRRRARIKKALKLLDNSEAEGKA